MSRGFTAKDALALLSRSKLPTVITEGSDDYRVMRKLERKLEDLGVDFLPAGGRTVVLEIIENLPADRLGSIAALVDLDEWLYIGIPNKYHSVENLFFTNGYSIENDIFLDSSLLNLFEGNEESDFKNDLEIVLRKHAKEIKNIIRGSDFQLKTHAREIIAKCDEIGPLDDDELKIFSWLKSHFGQALRGKTLLEILVKQLSRPDRYTKFGYKQVYDIASSNPGIYLNSIEGKIRRCFI